MKNISLFILLILLIGNNVLATAQRPDILIFNGEQHSIYTNPLESYYDDQHPKPKEIFEFMCSANWRGYVATWKIENEALNLIKLNNGSCEENTPEIPIEKIFPEKKAPIKAIWFSGTIIIPQGKLVDYVHMGYGSTYERYALIRVAQGMIKKTFKFTNEEYINFRKSQFNSFKKTEKYRNKVKELMTSNSYSEEFIEDFLFHYDAEYYLSLDF